jgi:putative ABC transport system substrate-binding protein
MIFNPDTAPGQGKYYMPEFEAAARSLKVTPIATPVHNVAELETVITGLGREPGGGFVGMGDFFVFVHRASIISLAAQNKVPAVYAWREIAQAGGLLSYGPDLEDIIRRAAPMSIAFSRARTRGSFRFKYQPNLRWPLTSKPPRRSVLTFRPRSCWAPTR